MTTCIISRAETTCYAKAISGLNQRLLVLLSSSFDAQVNRLGRSILMMYLARSNMLSDHLPTQRVARSKRHCSNESPTNLELAFPTLTEAWEK